MKTTLPTLTGVLPADTVAVSVTVSPLDAVTSLVVIEGESLLTVKLALVLSASHCEEPL